MKTLNSKAHFVPPGLPMLAALWSLITLKASRFSFIDQIAIFSSFHLIRSECKKKKFYGGSPEREKKIFFFKVSSKQTVKL